MLRYELQLSLTRLCVYYSFMTNNHITHAVAVITKQYDDILTDLICSDITLEKKNIYRSKNLSTFICRWYYTTSFWNLKLIK